jgi:membrane associated rhomboid family serine protease
MSYRVSYRNAGGLNMGPMAFLLIINFLMWVATSIKPDLFIGLFGLYPRTVLSEPWTVVTSMFIHSPFIISQPFSSIWHILANMWMLYFFGSYLIRLIGEGRFMVVYFIGGIVGSLAFILLANPYSVAIGASGAIFALAGALTVLRPRMTVVLFPIPLPMPLWVFVIGGFILLSFAGGVAWQAHLGGLVFGLIIGYFFRRKRRGFYLD